MPGLRRALVALFVVGVLFAAADVAIVLTSSHDDQKVVDAILGPLIGLSFIGTGVFAWWRRPLNRFGLLMTAVGFAWFVGALVESDNALVSTIGSYVGPLYLVLVVQLVLSFPTGRLETTTRARDRGRRLHRRVRPDAAGLPARRQHQQRLEARRTTRSRSSTRRGVADVVDVLTSLIGFAIAAATAVVLLRRGGPRRAPQRRAQAPMLWTGLTRVHRRSASLFGGDAVGVPDEVARGRRARRLRRVRDPAVRLPRRPRAARATRAPARSAA